MLSMPLFLLEPGPTRPNVLACFASVPTYAYATYASVSADAYTTESNGLTDSYATHALAYSALLVQLLGMLLVLPVLVSASFFTYGLLPLIILYR